MSDLCYNCGDCHLPRPCTQQLKQCQICTHYGHTYNFCPLSVRQKDPNYQFWALCHNCDKWHLPDPCQIPLHRCKQCSNIGHKEFFCPIDAVVRMPLAPNAHEYVGMKRQRTNGSDVSEMGVQRIMDEVAQKTRAETASHVMYFIGQGVDRDRILHFFGAPVPQINPILRAITNGPVAHNNDSTPNTPTPVHAAQTAQYSTQAQAVPGLYSVMQDRFDRGNLVNNQTQTPVQAYATPYMDDGNSNAVNGHEAGENINVGAAGALQDQAQSAIAEVMTTVDPSANLYTTAPNNNIGAVSQAPNFVDHLAGSVATTGDAYNINIPALANATPHQNFAPMQITAPENMSVYNNNMLPVLAPNQAAPVDSPLEEDPPLLLRKDGKPRKRQPPRKSKLQGNQAM